jgi:hypothetical protein
MVPRAEPQSYYGQPVIKEPVWTWEIPLYFFTGGLAGASSGLAFLADLRGNKTLARNAWALGMAGLLASPPLLISDLGRPSRFLNMLRVFKVTSPMSVGSWLLNFEGMLSTVAAANAWTGALEGPAAIAKPAAAAFGLPVATYTAALIANTSIPVWHRARWTLPFLFASGAAVSAGAAAAAVTAPRQAAPARRLALMGAAGEVIVSQLMEQDLGELGKPYHEGAAGNLNRVSGALTVAGGFALASRLGSRRSGAAIGGALLLAGALAKRWSVFRAGFQSASDPAYTVEPQRQRIAEGRARGASRSAR